MYRTAMEQYVDNSLAGPLTGEEDRKIGPKTSYLPHLGVVNPNKPGKVRCVFDAASKYGGQSLNSLIPGPSVDHWCGLT